MGGVPAVLMVVTREEHCGCEPLCTARRKLISRMGKQGASRGKQGQARASRGKQGQAGTCVTSVFKFGNVIGTTVVRLAVFKFQVVTAKR